MVQKLVDNCAHLLEITVMYRASTIKGGCFLLAFFLAGQTAVVAQPSTGVPIRSHPTHLNVSPDQFVTLLNTGIGLTRVFPDGTLARPFVIPDDKILIITDVAWRAATTTANAGIEYRIEIDNVDDQVVLYAAHGSTDASGAASHNHSFTGGLAVATSEVRPTVNLEIFARQDASGVSHDSLVHVYGYLVSKQ